MKNMIKKQTVFGWLSIAAGIIALVALIIYCVNSDTGYLASLEVNSIPIAFGVIAIVLLIGAPIVADKMDSRIPPVFVLIAAVLLSISACVFIYERLTIFGDEWFIPTTPPAAESAAVPGAMAGIILYFVAAVAAVAACFGKLNKSDTAAAEAAKA